MPQLPRFPKTADVIAQAAARERHLTIDERLARLSSLIAASRILTQGGANESRRRQFKLRMESATQRAHREVFERHGR